MNQYLIVLHKLKQFYKALGCTHMVARLDLLITKELNHILHSCEIKEFSDDTDK